MTASRSRHLLICLLILSSMVSRLAAAQEIPAVRAVRVTTAPHLDGILRDSVWTLARPAEGFRQRDPVDGAAATAATEVRVLYDNEALYFGCRFFDPEPGKITARLARRDDEDDTDRGSIRIDTFHDHQNAYELTFNPVGVRVDILQYRDGQYEDNSWDPVWQVETQIDSLGWTAELRVPFSILRYPDLPPGVEQTWGINFLRSVFRMQEETRWSYTPKSAQGLVSRFGHLEGLVDLPQPRRIEVMPFGLIRQEWRPADGSLGRSSLRANGGLDLKVGLANNFVLDATINPDFGQVEADPAVLNLSTIESYYPERRPFFIEGMQIFRFSTFGGDGAGPGLFYSRRIGRALGEDHVPLEEGERLVKAPQAATILGAVKVAGKTAGGLSVGVLQAVTDREYAIVEKDGRESERQVETAASYSLVRLRQDVLDGSSIGMMATAVARESHAPAFTGGFDWNLYDGERKNGLTGFLAGSLIGTPAGNRLGGIAGNIELSRAAAEHWLWSLNADLTTKQYQINDIGFFRRPNDYGGFGTLTYKEDVPAAVVRRYSMTAMLHERHNFDGAQLFRAVELQSSVLLTGFEELGVSLSVDAGRYDDRETRGYGLYEKPVSGAAMFSVSSDYRKDVVVAAEVKHAWDRRGKRGYAVEAELEFRPASWTAWEIKGEGEFIDGQEAWMTNEDLGQGAHSIFAERDTRAISATLRGSVTFRRDMTLQLYAQVFTAKGRYRSPRVLRSAAMFEPFSGAVANDFAGQEFNMNLVFRWEYLPGSTLYLVLSQARLASSYNYSASWGNDLADLFASPPSTVLIGKMTFWWNI
jgi:hypothetical protein